MCPLIIYWIIIVPIYLAEEDLLDGRPVAHKWFASLFTSALISIIHEAPTQLLSHQVTNLNSEESWKELRRPFEDAACLLVGLDHIKIDRYILKSRLYISWTDLAGLSNLQLMRFSGKRDILYWGCVIKVAGSDLGSQAVLETFTSLWPLSAFFYRFRDVS